MASFSGALFAFGPTHHLITSSVNDQNLVVGYKKLDFALHSSTMSSSDSKGNNDNDGEGGGNEETPDEWTILADTYTSVLVPSFAPIYNAIADAVLVGGVVPSKILDLGVGLENPY